MRHLPTFRVLLTFVGLGLFLTAPPGCHFDPSGVAPTDVLGECSATVRGLDGAGAEFTLTSTDPELGDRFLAEWCIPGSQTWAVRLQTEWTGHLTDTLAGDFRSHPGPWCVVEGSSRCRWGAPVDPFYPCPPPLSGGTPIGLCPGVAKPICVQLAPFVDFGGVDVGTTGGRSFEILNTCSEAIDVRVGESILGPQADEFEITDNRCAPAPGESFRSLAAMGSPGDRCDLEVAFSPFSPGDRSAEHRFVEWPDTTVVMPLRGEGLGARASVSPDYLCLDLPLSGPEQCTEPKGYTVTNLGGGGIRVVDGVLDPTGIGFRAIAPTPPRDSFIARNDTATVTVQWCEALSAQSEETASYHLTLTSDGPASQEFALRMEKPCP